MASTLKTNQTIAYEVIDGKWGNGQDRRNRLTKAGYNYMAVQTIVNAIVAGKYKPVQEAEPEYIVTGTEMMEIEVDLTKYKGISLNFTFGDKDADTSTAG